LAYHRGYQTVVARQASGSRFQNILSQIGLGDCGCLFRRHLGHCIIEHAPHDCYQRRTECGHDHSPDRELSSPTPSIATSDFTRGMVKIRPTYQFSIKDGSNSIIVWVYFPVTGRRRRSRLTCGPSGSTPMCGRLRVGKDFLHLCRLVGAPMCSACCAVHMTAGHNALRGSGPDQYPAFDNARG